MQYQKLFTRNALKAYLYNLAQHCKTIPGAKVKSSQLLEAAAIEEGKENFDQLSPLLPEIENPFTYTQKEIHIWFRNNQLHVDAVFAHIQPKGHWAPTVKIEVSKHDATPIRLIEPTISTGGKKNKESSLLTLTSMKCAIDEIYTQVFTLNQHVDDAETLPLHVDDDWQFIISLNNNLPTAKQVRHYLNRKNVIIHNRKTPSYQLGKGFVSEPVDLMVSTRPPYIGCKAEDFNSMLDEIGDFPLSKDDFRKITSLYPRGEKMDNEYFSSAARRATKSYGTTWPIGSTISVDGDKGVITNKTTSNNYEQVTITYSDGRIMHGINLATLYLIGAEVLLLSLPKTLTWYKDAQ